MNARYIWLSAAMLICLGVLGLGLHEKRPAKLVAVHFSQPRGSPEPFSLNGLDTLTFCGIIYDLRRPYLREGLQDALDFFCDRQGWLAMTFRRQSRYGPLIRQELLERGLHNDLVYLFAWESELNPWARSWADARGIAQLMPQASREMGLTVNQYVDERYDVWRAVPAGCRYLSIYYPYFKDYLLVMAAYNAGPERTRLRSDEQGTEDYFLLFQRPETRRYAFWVLALKLIDEHRQAWLPQLAKQAGYLAPPPVMRELVYIRRKTNLRSLADSYGYDYELFLYLNPQLRQPLLPAGVQVPVNTLANGYSVTGFHARGQDPALASVR